MGFENPRRNRIREGRFGKVSISLDRVQVVRTKKNSKGHEKIEKSVFSNVFELFAPRLLLNRHANVENVQNATGCALSDDVPPSPREKFSKIVQNHENQHFLKVSSIRPPTTQFGRAIHFHPRLRKQFEVNLSL